MYALLKNTIGYTAYIWGGNLVASFGYFVALGAINPFDRGQIGELTSATKNVYRNNVKQYLESIINGKFANGEVTAAVRDQGLAKTDTIAQAYVDVVYDNIGLRGGWIGNLTGSGLKCVQWVAKVSGDARLMTALNGSGFRMRTHYDVQKFGWYNSYTILPNENPLDPGSIHLLLPIHPLHSFITLTFAETTDPVTGKTSAPDVVLDAWSTNAPDIYEPRKFHRTWPVNISSGNTEIREP